MASYSGKRAFKPIENVFNKNLRMNECSNYEYKQNNKESQFNDMEVMEHKKTATA